MSIIRLCTPLSVLFFVGAAHAEVNCDKVSNYKDVIECAEARSPEVAKAEGSLKEKAARVDAAAQFANPSISLSSVSGTIDSDRKVETDVALSFPIELGGKRAARKKVASVEESRAQWSLYRTKAEVRKEVTIKLLRIKQIERELGLVEESVSAFAKLVKQYEGRPARSPEQDVSLTVFKIAKSEYDLKKTEYDEELLTLESYFLVTAGPVRNM
jgi:cobalt-zinc-cadmium efflux system outer membrane protein